MTFEQGEQLITILTKIQEHSIWIVGLLGSIVGAVVVMIFFIAKGDINS